MKTRLLVLASALLVAVPAFAQDRPDQGGTGVSGGTTTSTPETPQDQSNGRSVVTDVLGAVLTGPTWNLGFSLYGGYNQTSLSKTSSGSGALASFTRNGVTAGGTTQLGTSVSLRRLNISLGGGTSTNYFRATDRFMTSMDVRGSQSLQIGRRTTLAAGEAVNISPYYSLNQFVGLQNFNGTDLTMPAQGTIDTALGDSRQYRYTGMLQLTHPLTDRTSVAVQYSAQMASLNAATPDQLFQTADFRASHRLTAGLGYHVGYGYNLATFRGSSGSSAFHNLDIGLDMNRGLSLTRRTKLSFSTGTTMNRTTPVIPGSAQPAPAQTQSPTHVNFNLIGRANLTHNIGRSWNARVAYERAWQIIDGTATPSLGDALSGGVSGALSNSVAIGSNVAYMVRDVQAAQGTAQGHAISSSTFLNFRPKNAVAGFVQYSHYRQKIDLSQTGLTLPQRFSRNSVRAGLTLSFRSR